MNQEKRIAALEGNVQELQREHRRLARSSILLSIGLIILGISVIFGRWRIDRILIDIENQISSLSSTMNDIIGIDFQIIGLLQDFQQLLVRIIDLT